MYFQVGINVNQDWDGTWRITTANLQHSGHLVSRNAYYSNGHVKQLNPEDFDFIKDLKNANALPRNIAQSLSDKKGQIYNSEEVHYIMKKITDL